MGLILFLIIFIWILAFAPSAIYALTVIWCIALCLFCILSLIHCAIYFYFYSQHGSKQQEKSWNHPVSRLIVLNFANCLFFIFLTASSIHFAADPLEHMTCSYMFAYYVLCILFLLFLIIFYTQWLFANADPNDIESKMGAMIDDKSVPLSPEDGDAETTQTVEMQKKRPSFLSAPFTKIIRRHSNNGNAAKPMAQLDMFSSSAPPQSPDSMQKPLNETSPSKSTKNMIDTVFDQVLVDGTTTSIAENDESEVELSLENNNTFIMIDYDDQESERLDREFQEREKQREKELEEAEAKRLAALKKQKEKEHNEQLENERLRQLDAIYKEKERAKQQRLKEIEAEKEKQRKLAAEEERLRQLKEAEAEKERLREIKLKRRDCDRLKLKKKGEITKSRRRKI